MPKKTGFTNETIMNEKINICQPGFSASCSLCCGSHNFSPEFKNIDNVYKKRGQLYRSLGCDTIGYEKAIENNNDLNLIPRRVDEGTECPFLGYIYEDRQVVGCLAYSNPYFIRKERCDFFNNTCKKFSCLARDTLNEYEIKFAAELMRDWFYYSLLINEINILRTLTSHFKKAGSVPAREKERIRAELLFNLNEYNPD